MTIKDARKIKDLLESYDQMEALPDKVHRMYKKREHEQITNLLFELIDARKRDFESEINTFSFT